MDVAVVIIVTWLMWFWGFLLGARMSVRALGFKPPEWLDVFKRLIGKDKT